MKIQVLGCLGGVGGLGRQVSGGAPTPQPTLVTYVNIWEEIRSAKHLNVVIWALDRTHLDLPTRRNCFSGNFGAILAKTIRIVENHEKPWKSGFSWFFLLLDISWDSAVLNNWESSFLNRFRTFQPGWTWSRHLMIMFRRATDRIATFCHGECSQHVRIVVF